MEALFICRQVTQGLYLVYQLGESGTMEKKRILKIATSKSNNKSSAKKTITSCVEALKVLQADVYTLYLKTQNYHWNVVGPNFMSYHLMFEKQYEDLAEAADTIAERIRALGEVAPASFEAFLALKSIPEGKSHYDAMKMIEDLVESHIKVCDWMKEICSLATEEVDDATLNLIGERLEVHEKTIWMLKSHLE